MNNSFNVKKANAYSSLYELRNKALNPTSNEMTTYSTGMKGLDEALGGGLSKGLVLLGGRSGLGKTAFAMEILENIVMKYETDLLVFSLEMEKEDLIARSLSRISILLDKNEGLSIKEVLNFKRTNKYEAKKKTLKHAFEIYNTYANRINIFEGNGEINSSYIRMVYESYKMEHKKKPIILIDYLQLLSKLDRYDSDIDKIDKNVMELRRLARDEKIPVILISSMNRGSYKEESSESSFKGSSGIEYTADLVLSMDLDFGTLEHTEENYKKLKAEEIKRMCIQVLKNRTYGLPQNPIQVSFHSKYFLFYASEDIYFLGNELEDYFKKAISKKPIEWNQPEEEAVSDIIPIMKLESEFEKIRNIYPKKANQQKAFECFKRMNPTFSLVDLITDNINIRRMTEWKNLNPNDLKYIPPLQKFLEEESFRDDLVSFEEWKDIEGMFKATILKKASELLEIDYSTKQREHDFLRIKTQQAYNEIIEFLCYKDSTGTNNFYKLKDKEKDSGKTYLELLYLEATNPRDEYKSLYDFLYRFYYYYF